MREVQIYHRYGLTVYLRQRPDKRAELRVEAVSDDNGNVNKINTFEFPERYTDFQVIFSHYLKMLCGADLDTVYRIKKIVFARIENEYQNFKEPEELGEVYYTSRYLEGIGAWIIRIDLVRFSDDSKGLRADFCNNGDIGRYYYNLKTDIFAFYDKVTNLLRAYFPDVDAGRERAIISLKIDRTYFNALRQEANEKWNSPT